MTLAQVEWVLVIFYGKTAHRAIYGRLTGEAKYSKDYIQLSRKDDFISDLKAAFPSLATGVPSTPITYKWISGSAAGTIFRVSADRPHLAWETNSAPLAWKMHPTVNEFREETIVGDPSLKTAASADGEFFKLAASGFGQPFLIATKLVGEVDILHLRVQVENPGSGVAWADIGKAPQIIRELAGNTTARPALAWRYFAPSCNAPKLFFDPTVKAHPWSDNPSSESPVVGALPPIASAPLEEEKLNSDSLAEGSEVSIEEIAEFEQQVSLGSYRVADTTATTKTRGSAQRVFADAVKGNYKLCCAITGIKTRAFLVASHIVPWSVDENIRLDPCNGICLSVLADRAFENGYLTIEDDLTVSINWKKVGGDLSLGEQLKAFDGRKLTLPTAHPPNRDYLRRRREMQ